MDQKDLAVLNHFQEPVNLLDTPNYFTGVIYGDFGVGKTVWSGLFGKTLFLAADQGFKSLKNHPELGIRSDVAHYQGPKHWKAIVRAICERAPKYADFDTFVVDTMSHIQEDLVGLLVETSKYTDGKQRPRVVYNDPKDRIDGDPMELAGPPDWNRAKAYFGPGILRLVKAPINVIFIAHEREPGWMEKSDKDKPSELLALRPSITESLFKVIAREADFIGHMERDRDSRTISFQRSKKAVAKSRIKELDASQRIAAKDAARILNEWRYRGD